MQVLLLSPTPAPLPMPAIDQLIPAKKHADTAAGVVGEVLARACNRVEYLWVPLWVRGNPLLTAGPTPLATAALATKPTMSQTRVLPKWLAVEAAANSCVPALTKVY